MFWIKPKVVDVKPGAAKSIILLADRSSSMSPSNFIKVDESLPRFREAIPELRVFCFHADFLEVQRGKDLYSVSPSRGNSKDGREYRNCTYLGACLESMVKLNPSKTIVLSDGGIADQERALDAADRMSGIIDAYFFNSGWEDRPFMEKLARRGRGRFVPVRLGTTDICGEIRVSIGPRFTEVRHAPQWAEPIGRPSSGNIGATSASFKITRR